MDEYLDYLSERIEKLRSKDWTQVGQALAEYNRALDFARRKGLTSR